jgi:putative transposase
MQMDFKYGVRAFAVFQFWGRHLWARGYFCCSSGNVTDDVISKCIAEQNTNQDDDFKVDG